MEVAASSSFPAMHELLERISPKQRFQVFETLDLVALVIGSAAWIGATVLQALGNSGNLAKSEATWGAVVFLTVFFGMFAIWCVGQGLWMARSLREGLHPAARHIEERFQREQALIKELRQCEPWALKSKAKHLEIEAKHQTRRAAVLALLIALGVAGANLIDIGEKTQLWGALIWLKVIVSASSIGALIASVINTVLAGRLERLAGLFSLAAEPATSQSNSNV